MKHSLHYRSVPFISIILIAVSSLTAGLLAGYFHFPTLRLLPPIIFERSNSGGNGCAARKTVQKEEYIVRGDSLPGLLESGTRIAVLRNYYACRAVERGDIVAYRYAGDASPIVKVVKAIPGDTFSINNQHLYVNGKLLRTSRGEPYSLGKHSLRLLSLYIRDYHGRIPPDAYLILGNIAAGSLDSSRFGFVGRQDLIGKVFWGSQSVY